jgi:hypothetical protein
VRAPHERLHYGRCGDGDRGVVFGVKWSGRLSACRMVQAG